MTRREALKKLNEYAKNRTGCNGKVRLEHSDGSIMTFTSSWATVSDDWLFIITEHHGNCCYEIFEVLLCEYAEYKDNGDGITGRTSTWSLQYTEKFDD